MSARPRGFVGLALIVAATLCLSACGASAEPILANPTAAHPAPAIPPVTPPPLPDPQPLVFPRDDGPHSKLTEWWYYTGHLTSDTGRRFGFEFVIFRAERGGFPVSWASHLALTDEQGRQFLYDQRSEIGPQVDQSPRAADGTPTGFALAIGGLDPSNPSQSPGTPWSMTGANGTDRLVAASTTAGFGLQLALSTAQPPVLHDTVGYVDFGEAGGSYYYSRPRLDATGALRLGSETLNVTGTAWFDHQWGNFISVGGGGWDWFALNLADGTDLTLSLVRDASGAYPLVYGTLVRPDGTVQHLAQADFTVSVLGSWTSPTTGARYPAGWHLVVPSDGLDVTLQPTLADQELDTRPTTGVIYWEGSQRVTATEHGAAVRGEAYVELTGYAGATATR
jgi:predicted secreted hydrolase